jgi:hypothetical protein
MAGFLTSPWINVVAAVVGGLLLGFGIGRFAHEPTVPAGLATVFGLILLWWAVSDRRKFRRGTPESETDGSHTVE